MTRHFLVIWRNHGSELVTNMSKELTLIKECTDYVGYVRTSMEKVPTKAYINRRAEQKTENIELRYTKQTSSNAESKTVLLHTDTPTS